MYVAFTLPVTSLPFVYEHLQWATRIRAQQEADEEARLNQTGALITRLVYCGNLVPFEYADESLRAHMSCMDISGIPSLVFEGRIQDFFSKGLDELTYYLWHGQKPPSPGACHAFLQTLAPASLDREDVRLNWYETLETYLSNRATFGTVIHELKQMPRLALDYEALLKRFSLEKAVRYLREGAVSRFRHECDEMHQWRARQIIPYIPEET